MTFRVERGETEEEIYIEACSKITASDYQDSLRPILNELKNAGKRVRLLMHFGTDFKGYTAGAVWEDAKMGFQFIRTIDRCAIVSQVKWLKNIAYYFGKLTPCSVTTYNNSQIADAKTWLRS